MDGQSTHPRKAQLDKEEREHLEAVVTGMRDRVEANVASCPLWLKRPVADT
jgi:hypothetical protein